MFPSSILPFALAALIYSPEAAPTPDPLLQVPTASGTLHGFIDPSTPAVRQFLGIPFTLPPTQNRRWLPPHRVPVSLTNSTSINATRFGPSCPQIGLSAQTRPDVFSSKPGGGNQTQFFPVEEFSEDCLTLNVWAPLPVYSAAGAGAQQNLPVLVWFFGGGFVQGGAHSLYFNPARWVQRTQAHLVVSVNFRSNILGFPNAAGLGEQNLGLLDQRASLEWVRANIDAFGGDVTRIVAWGESAGAIAVDWLNFAFPVDPIVSGAIMESGTALFPPAVSISNDTAQANFAYVGAQLGCSPGAGQVDCLRAVAWQDIEALLAANTSIPPFLPVIDNLVVFADYEARYAAGAVARVPAIIGTNEHELNALEPGQDFLANQTFLCTAAQTSRLRAAQGLTTFRYRYDGNFADISPPGFEGAYHAAEVPLIFGTEGEFHGPATGYERAVGDVLQDLWVGFARDPEGGLPLKGWDSAGAGKAVLLGDVDEPLKVIDLESLEGAGVCPT
ncbi:Alpha/Beta hydrolase protein [Mycena haematopus]|nr:Alpha/Beta hydrolase protein [Mycena haematopus]